MNTLKINLLSDKKKFKIICDEDPTIEGIEVPTKVLVRQVFTTRLIKELKNANNIPKYGNCNTLKEFITYEEKHHKEAVRELISYMILNEKLSIMIEDSNGNLVPVKVRINDELTYAKISMKYKDCILNHTISGYTIYQDSIIKKLISKL